MIKIPLQPNKKIPFSEEWQKLPQEELDFFATAYTGIGIRCGDDDIIGIDIDVPIPELCDAILASYPGITYRIGQAPKFLIPVRCAAIKKKLFSKSFFHPDLNPKKPIRVEILSKGQQFVARGIHPDTKKPYVWFGQDPIEDDGASIPVWTQDQVMSVVRKFEELAADPKYRLTEKPTTSANRRDTAAIPPPGQLILRPAKVKSALAMIKVEELSYDDWVNVGMALHHMSAGGAEGLKYWTTWSAIDTERFNQGECASKYAGFALNERNLTERILYSIAKNHGWEGKYSLIIPEMEKLCILERDRVFQEFNSFFGTINVGGDVKIVDMTINAETNENKEYRVNKLPSMSLNKYVQAAKYPVYDKSGESPKIEIKQMWEYWIYHRERRDFPHGVTFRPTPGKIANTFGLDDPTPGGQLNTFVGFRVAPVECPTEKLQPVLNHLFRVICNYDEDMYFYLIRWIAFLFQFPHLKQGVVPVLRSGQGTGKGIVTDLIGNIIGSHYLELINDNDLTGTHNGHLCTAILITLNEAVWGGHKSTAGILKGLITDPRLVVNPKYINPYTITNCISLIVTSNSDFVTPVEYDDRRYLYFDVNEKWKDDPEYFDPLIPVFEDPEVIAGMHHFFLNMNLDGFNVRKMPASGDKNKMKDKIQNLGSVESFILDFLEDPRVWEENVKQMEPISVSGKIPKSELFSTYNHFLKSGSGRFSDVKTTSRGFGMKLCSVLKGCRFFSSTNVKVNNINHYHFANVDEISSFIDLKFKLS